MAVAILECYDPVQTKSLQDVDLSDNSKGWMKVQDTTLWKISSSVLL